MEFQAVVMAAGKASRMTELAAYKPKCLLPIGNRPMIWYSLKMLEKVGFEEAIVVVQEAHAREVAAVAEKFGLYIRLDVVGIPKHEDWGTADSLCFIKDKIKADVLVVSCDLVTDVPLHNIINLHRVHGSSVTALFSPVSPDAAAAPVPGPKTKHKTEQDLVGLDPETSRLVFLASEADLDESLVIKKAILKLFPRVTIHSQLLDAHLYILKKWVCEYIAESRSFSMLKGEALPDLVRKQFLKPTKKVDSDMANVDMSVKSLHLKKADIFAFANDDPASRQVLESSLWNDHRGDLRGPYRDQKLRCYAYVAKEGICKRANSLASYCELNRLVLKQWQTLFPGEEAQQPSTKGQVGVDCIIGETTQLSDKCSIKHSVLGQHCRIEDKVKITNCVIMDYVTVKEGTTLQGCIVADNATIESRCDVKDCLVGGGYTVHTGTKAANEFLVDADRLMEI